MKPKFPIYHFDELASTNDYLKQNALNMRDQSVVCCDIQTKGRGRFERVWQSKEDLTFSILFKQENTHQILAPLALIRAFQHFHYDCWIKWPNDILYQGKKVAGILIEKEYEGNTSLYTIVGIGVNLTPVDSALEEIASNVQIAKKELLQEILSQYQTLLFLPKEKVQALYRKYNTLIGRKIKLNDVLWEVLNISEEGYLIVSNQEEIKELKNEEITLHHIYKE